MPHEEMSDALEALREKQTELTTAFAKLDEVTASATTKDRMIKATVDGRGTLTGLELNGGRWREMAPKELTTKIVEVVADAQKQAAAAVDEVMGGFSPDGVDLKELRENGPDVEGMINSMLSEAGRWSR